MSKYMHLKISVLPYYQNDLKDNYPNLARRLKRLASDLVERNPSLYEIAGQLDKLLYTFGAGLTPLAYSRVVEVSSSARRPGVHPVSCLGGSACQPPRYKVPCATIHST
jgi:hypothetical protein